MDFGAYNALAFNTIAIDNGEGIAATSSKSPAWDVRVNATDSQDARWDIRVCARKCQKAFWTLALGPHAPGASISASGSLAGLAPSVETRATLTQKGVGYANSCS